MSKFAWVTLTTNDTYSLGALVLAHSLKRSGTAHQLAVLVTPTVSDAMRDRLKDVYNLVQEVNVLDSQDAANLALLARPELGVTFTKLHCWRLEQYEKCVFLDADTLVLKNCDELFEREELSAAPDVSWPDCFNSGVFVFKPSLDTFNKITEFAIKHGSFDGGDQGLLNQYFADWSTADIKKHLPFVYNVTAYASYCYLPAFKQFRDKIKILHFAGKLKPWLIPFNSQTKTASTPHDYTHAHDLIQHWWTLFCDNVHNVLDNAMYPCLNITHSADYIENHDYQYDMDSYYYEHQQQEQQQPRQYVPHVREFRDPWADYYEQAEQAEQQQQQQQHVAATEPQNVFNHNENANANANKEQTAATNQVHDERTTGHSQSSDACSHMTSPPTPPPPPPPHEPPTEESIAINVNSNVQQNPNPNENHQLQHPEPNTYNIQNPEHNQIAAEPAAEPAVPHEAGLAGALAQLRIGVQRTPEQEHYENLMRRQCWESGQIDYAGADAFENIWKKITQTLEAKTEKTEDAEQTDNANASDNDNDNTTLSSNKLLTQSASQLLQQVSAASSRRSPSPRPAAVRTEQQSSNKTEATTSSRSQHIQQSTSTAAKARGQKGMRKFK
ncbi:glycogenin-2 isoform X1 [Drosophila busckii]|uniref:glycogenin-2 isoform X1 n=1 Tax=Drosophila busckii TaxID=30019 RepID=UPI00083EE0C7|nr:glycogenin-2 isoform X1 [Drosophila busckii]